jgi:hypothetical protein
MPSPNPGGTWIEFAESVLRDVTMMGWGAFELEPDAEGYSGKPMTVASATIPTVSVAAPRERLRLAGSKPAGIATTASATKKNSAPTYVCVA